MNFIFWSAALLMLVVALGFIIVPLLRARGTTSVAYKDSNLSLYEEKLAELETDLAEARISQEHYRVACQELDRELLDNVPAESASGELPVSNGRKNTALAIIMAVFVPAISLLIYFQLGTSAETVVQTPTGVEAQAGANAPSVEEMTLKLEKFLQENEGSVQEWRMLGRAYKHLQRYEESISALSHALELQPDAQLMLEKAEAMALLNGEVFTQEARDLVMQAKALEPDNINVLWFAGVAEFQLGNFQACIDNLSQLATVAKSDKDVNQSIRFYIEKARAELVAKGVTVASVDQLLQTEEQPTAAVPAASAAASLRVAVSVSAEARAKFSPEDTVFVYARAAQGPRMPLAVQRLTLAALPARVTLDDSMAMIDGMNLSAFPSVVVAARISRSGSAIAQSGDYIGEVQVNDVNSTQALITVSIDRVVP